MRRALVLPLSCAVTAAATLAVAVGTVGTVGAVGEDAAPAGAVPAPVRSASYYFAAGPSAVYDGDAGSIGQVDLRRITVPEGDAQVYDAVVTVGMQYRTRGDAPFTGGFLIRPAGTFDYLDAQPSSLRLAPTDGAKNATTLTFRVRGLRAGRAYQLAPSVNAAFGGRVAIRSSRVVVSVDLVPR